MVKRVWYESSIYTWMIGIETLINRYTDGVAMIVIPSPALWSVLAAAVANFIVSGVLHGVVFKHVAVGKAKMVTKEMVKKGAVVIDIGMQREDGKLVGDVDFDSVQEVASAITPVPGGVGPMTVACLIRNCVRAKERQLKN